MEDKPNSISPDTLAEIKSYSKKEMLAWIDKRIEAKKQALVSSTNNTALDQEIVDELTSLQELRKLYELPGLFSKPRNLWLFLLALLVPLIGVVVFLFWVRLDQTFIELNLRSSAVNFRTAEDSEQQPIVKDLDFQEITFNDVGFVETARARENNLETFKLTLEQNANESTDGGYIALEELIVPANTALYLSTPEDTAASADLTLSTMGTTSFEKIAEPSFYDAAIILCELTLPDENGTASEPGNQSCEDDFTLELEVLNAKEALTEESKNGSLVIGPTPYRTTAKLLRFNFKPVAESPKLAQQTQISSLSFMRFDELSDTQRTRGEWVSGIESGTLYYEGLAGKELQLRPGEKLRFEDARGTLRVLELAEGLITVQFRGVVSNMQTGSNSYARNLMPTYIERLRAEDSFKALLAGLITLVVGIIPVIPWQKLSGKSS
jgi:hypothetical protein